MISLDGSWPDKSNLRFDIFPMNLVGYIASSLHPAYSFLYGTTGGGL